MKRISAVIIDTFPNKVIPLLATRRTSRLPNFLKLYTMSDEPFVAGAEFHKIEPIRSLTQYSDIALRMDLPVMHRWIERPWLTVFPLIGLFAVAAIVLGVHRRRDGWPFAGAVLIFLAAFATLVASFLPYMVPFSLTISEAAAPASSLSFIFWGAGIVVLPLMLLYTVIVYTVFKGKVAPSAEYH